MNLTKSLALASMSLFFITSCSKNEDALTPTQSENISVSDDSIISSSHGGIVQSVFNEDDTNLLSKASTTFYSNWAEVSPSDLNELSKKGGKYNELDWQQNRFTSILNKGLRRPPSVSINGYRLGKGQNPNARENWKAEIRTVGKRIKLVQSKPTAWKNASSIISYRNNSGKREWMTYGGELRYTDTKTKGWSMGGSVALEVGGKIGIPLVTEGSTKLTVTMNGERNGSTTKSKVEVIKGNVGQWVEPRQVINFVVKERHINVTTRWKIPLNFKGKVGADFGRKKHHGAHYWSVSAAQFFDEYHTEKYKREIEIIETKDKEYRIEAYVTNN